jgi:hypothetical protein
MDEANVFDRLVRDLDRQERRALLVRIQGSIPVYTEPLLPEGQEPEPFVPEQEMERMGLLLRLLLLLRCLFRRQERVALLRERFLRRLAGRLQRSYPELLDFNAGRFRSGLYEQLTGLRKSLHVLQRPLAEVFGQTRSRGPTPHGEANAARGRVHTRAEFVAFMARDELHSFMAEVLAATDPQSLWDDLKPREERDVRAAMLERFDALMEQIPEASRRRMQRDTAALAALHALANHSFDSLLIPFRVEEPTGAPRCPFQTLVKPLKGLADALSAARLPPSAQALYDLFLFVYREQLEDEEFDLESRLTLDLEEFRKALLEIRAFHERVPLAAILRCLTRDPGYLPAAAPAGEEWLPLLKEFWRQRIHESYLDFFHRRLSQQLQGACVKFLWGKPLPELDNYRPDKFGAGTPVKHGLSMAFLMSFHRSRFVPLARALKLIYLNGEFYKEDNRKAYTDAFLFLSDTDKSIGRLEQRLGPQGDLRAQIQEAKGERLTSSRRLGRIRGILARADEDARQLLDSAVEQLESMKQLLYGILKGKPGDRFDTLMNFSTLGGAENKALVAAWSRAYEQAGQALNLLHEIRDLEISRSG